MFFSKPLLKVLTLLTVFTLIAACSDVAATKSEDQSTALHPIILDVYKTPTCGCCKKWISHLDDNGFVSRSHDKNDISAIKKEKGIEPRFRSCHTAISKEGYAFEGHVPAKFIQKFLKEKHAEDVIGLSVPAMPAGSPGMEMGDRFQPYKVLLLKSDGSFDVYAVVLSYKEQF